MVAYDYIQLKNMISLSSEELLARFAFWRAPGVGPALMGECLKYVGNISDVFKQAKDLPESLTKYIQKADWCGAEKDMKWLESPQHHLLVLGEENYPKALAEIAHAPPFIFIKGNVSIVQQPQLAIVGSRNPTHYGVKVTQMLARDLALTGLTVTSGLALGIDAIAHQSVLDTNGKTIGVLAVGLDQVYPKRHQVLAESILKHEGALVSEFGMGVKPLAENFPRRNRIISGLSMGVVVIEATVKSGSLITARYALEQAREVFAVPGSIFQGLAQGCHALIKQGAICVENVEDILRELPVENLQSTIDGVQGKNYAMLSLTEEEEKLLGCMNDVPQSFEDLHAQLLWSTEQLQMCLMRLELYGLVKLDWAGYVLI